MRPNILAIKLTDDEENVFQAVSDEFPRVTRSMVGSMLVLLGCIAYFRRVAQGSDVPDSLKLLSEAQKELAKKQKKT